MKNVIMMIEIVVLKRSLCLLLVDFAAKNKYQDSLLSSTVLQEGAYVYMWFRPGPRTKGPFAH